VPTLAESPSLTARLEDAIAALLRADSTLAGITVRTGTNDAQIETPFIAVTANRTGERIHNSGAYDCAVRIHLKTTMGNGPKATDDDGLLELDAAIESVIWGPSPRTLAASITDAADYLKCHAVTDLNSSPTAFDDTRREITYTLNAICAGLPEPEGD
jgi:hypothetical protein